MWTQKYGIGSAAVALIARSTTSWMYQGCYLDSVSNRTFGHFADIDGNTQTIETCTSYCTSNGYNWAGLEYGRECYCDYSLPSGATKEPEADCSMKCSGNSTQICGNGDRLSVYYNGNSGPSINPGVNGWAYLACYTDSTSSRTLRGSQSVAGGSSNMTVAGCTAACQSAGYSLAGVEFGQECWCDSTINSPATVAKDGCNMLCSGNSSEYCGSSVRLNVYRLNNTSTSSSGGVPAAWRPLGCYTDDVSNRTLATQMEVPGGYTNMTIEGCLSQCSSSGFSYGGLEYSQECYCSNSINNGVCAAAQSDCYQPCRGSNNEICGGPSRLNLYYSGSSITVAACSAPAGSTTTASTFSTIASTSSLSVQTTSSTGSVTGTSSSTTNSASAASSSTQTTSSSTSTSSSASTTPTTSSTTTLSIATTTSSPATSASTSSSTTTSSTATSSSPTSTVCPSFWSAVISDLAPTFRDSSGQCNSLARAAIRYAFHDAAAFSTKLPFYAPAAGGADGSLLLSSTEINRADNDGLHDFHGTLGQKFNAYQAAGYSLSAADLIQVAGALGVIACPGGRIGRVYVGRGDTNVAAPEGLLPNAFGNGSDHDTIYNLFTDKGFSARDLAALMGAHSTALANFQISNGIPAGTPLDDTPGLWDVNYYNDTYFPPPGVGRLDSDINLSKNTASAVGKQFKSFVGAQAAWAVSFQSAFQVLSLLGVPSSVRKGMQDCTVVVNNAYS